MHFEIYGDVEEALKCALVQATQAKQNVYLLGTFQHWCWQQWFQSWPLRPFVTHEKIWV